MQYYIHKSGRCLYCNLCVEVCPVKTLVWDKDYAISTWSKETMTHDAMTDKDRADLAEFLARVEIEAAEEKAKKEAEAAAKAAAKAKAEAEAKVAEAAAKTAGQDAPAEEKPAAQANASAAVQAAPAEKTAEKSAEKIVEPPNNAAQEGGAS